MTQYSSWRRPGAFPWEQKSTLEEFLDLCQTPRSNQTSEPNQTSKSDQDSPNKQSSSNKQSPSFIISEVKAATGAQLGELNQWVKRKLVIPSIDGRRFSSRDILVAAVIRSIPSYAPSTRRMASNALYSAQKLSRYLLTTKTYAEMAQEMRGFRPRHAWPSHLFWIVDLRALYRDVSDRYEQYRLQSISRVESYKMIEEEV